MIRGVPDEVNVELAARAALMGRSLQEYLRGRLAEAWVAKVRARKLKTHDSESVDRIMVHRDADRR
jgi:plasmid stability protein